MYKMGGGRLLRFIPTKGEGGISFSHAENGCTRSFKVVLTWDPYS